jgi:hypothetical protein
MPADDNNNSSGGDGALAKGWNIAKGVGWAMIPGTGLVDAYHDFSKGNYWDAALNVAMEVPVAKVFKAGKAVKAGIKGAEAVGETTARVGKGLGKLAKEAKVKPDNCLGCGELKKAKDAAVEGKKKGGRLGNKKTREHIEQVADELESRGWTITGGGGRLPEEYLPGPGGARKGSSYPDITATKNGRTLRINTVDTHADGISPTTRETTNAARIRSQTPGDHLLTIPKPK